MSTNPTARLVTEFKPKFEIKVDLDERSFLFPAGKSISQLQLLSDGRKIHVEAVYPFNQTHTPPRLLSLDPGRHQGIGSPACRGRSPCPHAARFDVWNSHYDKCRFQWLSFTNRRYESGDRIVFWHKLHLAHLPRGAADLR